MYIFTMRCHERTCSRPWGHIYNGVLSVESRHGGEVHSNSIALATLLKLLQNSRYALAPDEMRQMLEELELPTVTAVDETAQSALGYGKGGV